ncbi:hypothetical protein Acor_24520 [Acrocarpospora corrugata]|uniref:Serine-threonine protein kinase n=1 Tax=Acrocarpospora corrugata TaxID=35763 RepID=A0A5M3W196_9ACTN|nr:hypothetical protein [Acrocarpospora corrugata]GES00388.1 hypothetical protein Acor_24520 [Acrocarpospora corrugata]
MRFPFAKVQFRSDGELHDPAERQRALDMVRAPGVTDVLLLSHGWNNDMAAAERLYEKLAESLDEVRRPPSMRLAVIGVLWPSVRWAEPGLLAGGGLGADDGQALLRAEIEETVEDAEIATALQALVPDLHSPGAQASFLDLLRRSLPAPADGDEEPPPSLLTDGDPEAAFDLAAQPLPLGLLPEAPGGAAGDALGGGTAGGAAPGLSGGAGGGAGGGLNGGSGAGSGGGASGGLGGGAGGGAGLPSFGDVLHAGRLLLNTTTYFTMKERAGTVGSVGVARLMDDLAAQAPGVRRHLAGHSFGARLVTAAAQRHAPVHSVSLLQAAFSHYALATDYSGTKDGLFRNVLSPGRLAGPMVITHTVNDRAVGIAYAIISRLAQQNASSVGGPDDSYGGIGRNGALRTPQVSAPPDELLPTTGEYDFRAGRVYNLRSDDFIHDHGSVTGREVANAMMQAMALSHRDG